MSSGRRSGGTDTTTTTDRISTDRYSSLRRSCLSVLASQHGRQRGSKLDGCDGGTERRQRCGGLPGAGPDLDHAGVRSDARELPEVADQAGG